MIGAFFLASALTVSLSYDGIEIRELRPLFAGSQEEWIPFLISLENLSQAPRQLEVRLRNRIGRRVHTIDWVVELSPGARKQQVLPCYRGRTRFGGTGQVEIYENGKRLTPENDLALEYSLMSPARRGGQQRPVSILFVHPRDGFRIYEWEHFFRPLFSACEFDSISADSVPTLPDAYAAIDRLVFLGVSPRTLSPAQRRGVERAVQDGLRAWIVPGKAGEGNDWVLDDAQPPPTPAILAGETVNVFLFEPFDRDPGVPVSSVVTDGGDEIPSVYRYRSGQGEWRRLTGAFHARIRLGETDRRRFGIDLDPLQSGQRWIRPGSRGASAGYGGRWHESLDLLYRPRVPLEWVFILLTVYLLGVGPGVYWLLRRSGKLIWLLWLQPVIVVAFLLFTYFIGVYHFGAASAAYETVVVFQKPGTTHGSAVSAHTQYSARETRADLRTGDGALPVLLADPNDQRSHSWRIDPQGGNRLQDFPFPTWSYHHFSTSGPLFLGGSLWVTEHVEPRTQNKVLRIRNELPFAVENPLYLDKFHFVTRIPPGGEVELSLAAALPLDAGLGEREFARLQLGRSVGDRVRREKATGNAHLSVGFHPDELPQGVPFSVVGDKRAREGVLVVPVRSEP